MPDRPAGEGVGEPARSGDALDALVTSAQRGDKVAFGELVQQTYARVYNLAYQILRNARDAEDLTQDVFVRVWRSLPGFRGESRFTTWLYRVVTNAGLNRRRQLRGQSALIGDAPLDEIAAPATDVEGEAQTRDRNTRLWAAVARLPDRYRLVLSLFYQHQLPYEQVARTLSLPLGTVKAQLNRARHALAGMLKEEDLDGVL